MSGLKVSTFALLNLNPMSNTKIVIDKDKVGKSEHSEIINAAISVLIKHGVATEIQIDQSIEERATEFLDENCILDKFNGMYGLVEPKDLVNFATQQQIIEQLKVKEKEYQIDFGNHLRCGLKVIENKIEILGAVNGWGNNVPNSEIVITTTK